MESTPVSPGLSEGSLSTPETGKDKDKKSSEKKSVPLGFGFEVPQKSKDKGIVEFFRRPEEEVSRESKLFGSPKEDKNTIKPSTETDAESVESTTDDRLVAEPEFRIPTPEQAWARLKHEPDLAQGYPARPEAQAAVAVPETVLPMELGEIELPLKATEIHQRLQFPKAETQNEPTGPIAEQQATGYTSLPEARPELPAPSEAGSGGDNFEPPKGPESTANKPDPSPEQPSDVSPELTEAQSAHRAQAEEQHQVRIANAVSVSELVAPVTAAHETRVIERRGGGALAVGLIDWFGRRRLRREVRRGQKRQDKQLKQLEQRQNQSSEVYQRQITEQNSLNQRLRTQVDTLFRGNNQQRQQFEQQHSHMLEERRQVQVAEAAKRAAAQQTPETAPQLPTDHHLEHSTWHTIEVDKAGRAVERPTFVYGKEFQHEQQQEARRDDPQMAVSATGQLAVNGTQQAATPQSSSDGLQLPPSLLETKTQKSFSSRLPAVARNPLFLVLVIIVIFVVVSLIIVQ